MASQPQNATADGSSNSSSCKKCNACSTQACSSPTSDDSSPCDGKNHGSSYSAEPVRYSDGEVYMVTADLQFSNFGLDWGHTRSYSNLVTEPGTGRNGNSWFVKEWPYLSPSNLDPSDPNTPGTICLVWVVQQSLWFDYNATSGSFVARFHIRPKLKYDATNSQFTLTDSEGRVTKFYDFSASTPAALQGQFKSITDASGSETVAQYGSDDLIESFVQIVGSQSSGYYYTYLSSGENAGMLSQVRYEVNGAPVQRVNYSYYVSASKHGSGGDLERATVEGYNSGIWENISDAYYRYYKDEDAFGMAHGLRYMISPQNYQAMVEAGITPEIASNRQIANFARHEFRYETGGGVMEEAVNSGTTVYGYGRTQSSFAPGFNNWANKAVEDLPDGNRNIVYTNYAGQSILQVFIQMRGGNETNRQWYDYRQYDSAGRTTMVASSSAVASYDESDAGLVTLNAGSGLIRTFQYYPASPGPGGAPCRLQYEKVQEGSSGTPITLRALQYTGNTVGSATVYQKSQETIYQDASGGGTNPAVTTYSYGWTNLQVTSKKTTYPTVSSGQNGTGGTESMQEAFDNSGRLTWSQDPRGYITGYSYDGTTSGTATQMVQDVSGGAPWPVLPGAHLNLVTDYTVDSQGRTTQTLGPSHQIDIGGTATTIRRAQWTVYLDSSSQIWSGNGYQTVSGGSYTLINPVTLQRYDQTSRLVDEIQATRASTSGPLQPTDSFPQSNWTRWTYNDYGPYAQVANQLVYHSIPTSGYGRRGINYDQTSYQYDIMQRQVRERSPGGTITRYVYSPMGWVLSTWVGTNDAMATNNNPAGVGAVSNNMEMVEAYVYDHGRSGGDGNQTQLTQVAGEGDMRVTNYNYDWRNRRTSTKGEIDFFESYTIDNLDRVTQTDQHDTDSSGTLVGRQQTNYDNRGRVYRTSTYGVDPATGAVGNALAQNVWYDPSGNVIQQQGAGAQSLTVTSYDQINRPVITYLAVDSGGSGTPGDVSDDIVIQQGESTYDAAGNVTFQLQRARFHNATATATGPLTSPSGLQPKARVSYVANWPDPLGRIVANANYGTNGGTEPTPPAVAPSSSSDTMLVTYTAYNERGELYETTDAKGEITQFALDDAGRKISQIENVVSGGTGPDQNKETFYTYSPDGLLATLTAQNDITGDQVTEWVYGTSQPGSVIASSLLVASKIYPDTLLDKVDYQYNGLSQLIQTTDQRGTVHQYDYDKLGRLLNDRVTTLGSGVDGTVLRISYAYEVRGLTTSVTSVNNASPTAGTIVNQVVNSYNEFKQLVSQQQSHSGAAGTGTPQVGYAYADGSANTIRIEQMTYPNGRQLNYFYGTTGGTDDLLSRIDALIDNDGSSQLAGYQFVGQGAYAIVSYAQPGVQLTYVKQGSEPVGGGGDQYTGWDMFGRIIDQRWLLTASGTAIERLEYGYDRMNNRKWRQNLVASSGGQDGYYNYDGLYQLQELQRGTLNTSHTGLTGTPAWEEDFTYDPTGNWDQYETKVSGSTTLNQSRTHSEVNAIQTIAGSSSLVGYDAAGNMTKTPQPGSWSTTDTLTWDAWNRLISVSSAGSTLAIYGYDGLTRRVTATDSSGTRHYYYSDAWQILEERVGTSTTADRQFVWGQQSIDDLVLRDRTVSGVTERLYSMSDPLNVTAICNTSGVVQERYGYTAFGTPQFMDASYGSRTSSSYQWETLFGAYRFDSGTQFYQVRYRYLHSQLGRWLSRDPLKDVETFLEVSLYAYVGNRSIKRLDVSGLQEDVAVAYAEAIASGNVEILETLVEDNVLDDAEEAKAKQFIKRVGLCVTWNAAYSMVNCKNCKNVATKQEAIANAACFASQLALRKKFLDAKCDYYLAGSIARGSATAEAGHRTQLAQKTVSLCECTAKIASLPG